MPSRRHRRQLGPRIGTWLDPPLLGRTAPVMGDRRHVTDGDHPEAHGCQRLDGGLSAAPGALHPDVHPAEAQVHRLPAAVFRGDRGRERRRLLGALEAGLAGRAPREGIAPQVGDGDQQIVEGGRDVGDALGLDDFLGPLDAGRLAGRERKELSSYFFVAFFLPAMARRGPFLVRALV